MAPDAMIAWLDREDKDYADSSIANHGALAVPSVYVIDTAGKIVFDYVNANYKVRLSADDLLAAAKSAHSD
jgi:peroxiredoxin